MCLTRGAFSVLGPQWLCECRCAPSSVRGGCASHCLAHWGDTHPVSLSPATPLTFSAPLPLALSCVLIDDRPVGDYNRKWLKQRVALVSQEPVLYARSIRRCMAEEGKRGRWPAAGHALRRFQAGGGLVHALYTLWC